MQTMLCCWILLTFSLLALSQNEVK